MTEVRKPWITIQATAIVLSARRALREAGKSDFANLDGFGSILNKVLEDLPEEKAGDRHLRAALFDEAWSASIGSRKGIILLKDDDGSSRDGTKNLKSGLRTEAKGDWETFRAATKLVGLLADIKNCKLRAGTNDPDTESLFKVFKKHLPALSSPELWSSKRVRQSFSEYLGIPLSLLTFAEIGKKAEITADDVERLASTLKAPPCGEAETDGKSSDDLLEFLGIGKAPPTAVDLTQSKEDILFQMAGMIRDHYSSFLNVTVLDGGLKIQENIEKASSWMALINALVSGYDKALAGKVSTNRLAGGVGMALADLFHHGKPNQASS